MYCKAGLLAAKASQKQEAIDNFHHSLTLEPLLWEAWIGETNNELLGATVDLDEVLKPPPHLQGVPSAFSDVGELPSLPALAHPIVARLSKQYAMTPTPIPKGPSGTGMGFFTPEHGLAHATPLKFQLPAPQKS
ncbi:2985_t:CDS:2, partial [Acaulospora colombiana]